MMMDGSTVFQSPADEDGRIYAVDLVLDCRYAAVLGETRFSASMRNADRIIHRLDVGDYRHFLIDYRLAVPMLNPDEYAQFFQKLGPSLGRLESLVYIYGDLTLMRAAHASRQAQKLGVNALAIGDWTQVCVHLGRVLPDPILNLPRESTEGARIRSNL